MTKFNLLANEKTQNFYQKAKKIIPGGTQLFSKRAEMFLPGKWPAYYDKAKGVIVYDLDGNCFLDMSMMGIGACLLGYADKKVNKAVKQAIKKSVQCTLNVPEEVELAEILCKLHPWAKMVRYARAGGEAMSVAVRIARAYTKKDKIVVCGYHGWSDWYLAANHLSPDALEDDLMPGLKPAGVPKVLYGTTLPFHYNKIEELENIIKQHGSEIAAIVMEPQRDNKPENGFLEKVKEVACKIGAVLIFDEITTGFRMNLGGIHLLHNIEPDMAVFAKAMANGYAMAAVIGNDKVMQAAQDSFISSTNWTERIGPVAALATIKKCQEKNVAEHLKMIGEEFKKILKKVSEKYNIELEINGLASLIHFKFMQDEDLLKMSAYTQLMLAKNILACSQFKPSYAHKKKHLRFFAEKLDEVFMILKKMIQDGTLASFVQERAKKGFYRLN